MFVSPYAWKWGLSQDIDTWINMRKRRHLSLKSLWVLQAEVVWDGVIVKPGHIVCDQSWPGPVLSSMASGLTYLLSHHILLRQIEGSGRKTQTLGCTGNSAWKLVTKCQFFCLFGVVLSGDRIASQRVLLLFQALCPSLVSRPLRTRLSSVPFVSSSTRCITVYFGYISDTLVEGWSSCQSRGGKWTTWAKQWCVSCPVGF